MKLEIQYSINGMMTRATEGRGQKIEPITTSSKLVLDNTARLNRMPLKTVPDPGFQRRPNK